jgi:hypothetical protein
MKAQKVKDPCQRRTRAAQAPLGAREDQMVTSDHLSPPRPDSSRFAISARLALNAVETALPGWSVRVGRSDTYPLGD